MKKEIIETIKKIAKCEVISWGKEVNEMKIDLINPEEVADAVIKVIFGDILSLEKVQELNKRTDKKIVKAK